MATLTIRLPDETAERLKSRAKSRGLSTNKLVEKMSTKVIAARNTENHFRAIAASGDVKRVMAILDRLDADINGRLIDPDANTNNAVSFNPRPQTGETARKGLRPSPA